MNAYIGVGDLNISLQNKIKQNKNCAFFSMGI